MGFLDFISKFSKKEKNEHLSYEDEKNYDYSSGSEDFLHDKSEADKFEKEIYSREGVNFDDALERREYVQNCLVQMEEGNRQLEELREEYKGVTEYLQDMEIIGALSDSEKEGLSLVAARIHENEKERQDFLTRSGKLTDKEYERIEMIQGSEEKIIKKMEGAEDFQKKIRKDLVRLDNEKQAYELRSIEIEKSIATSKNLMIFTAIAFAIIVIALYAVNYFLSLNVVLGYMLAILVAAVVITYCYVKHGNFIKERKQAKNAKARLIQLQNTVKVRYVNNINLLDFMYLKYGVNSSKELKNLIARYHEERVSRHKFEEAERKLGEDQKELLAMLRYYKVRYPEVWLHRSIALINHNEEVEVRHELIVQRQNLRKRMDYNREIVVDGARKEIEDLAKTYPIYAGEILDQVARFRGVSI